MSLIKFKRIVSCSSQDPAYPAENLLKTGVNHKWKCSAGAANATVVIQLEKSTEICGIDIGNEGSAFIEVLAGRETVPDEFKVILVMSSFMTPMDARNETEKNRVRIFSKDHLCGDVAAEKWDQIKVVCTQPFNKHMQYGLSFLKLHGPDGASSSSSTTPNVLGRFTLKDDDDDISVGSIFARRKEEPEPSPKLPPPAATSWKNTTDESPSSNKDRGKKQPSKKNATPEHKPPKATARKTPTRKVDPASNEAATKATTKNKDAANKKDVRTASPPRTPAAKRPNPDDGSSSGRERKQIKVNPNVIYKPFNKLMEGVEIAISGYVNPGRADIRSRALEMGAKYRPDWTSTCTHLICAFANTPKFQQVKGKGKIVFRDWVDDCHRERKLLPWRRYAVDKADQTSGNNSDEKEVWELVEEPKRTQNAADRRNAVSSQSTSVSVPSNDSGSGSDTDDEVQRVVLQKKKIETEKAKELSNGASPGQKLSTTKNGPKTTEADRNAYDDSTDHDSDQETQNSKNPNSNNLPELPTFFSNKTFYIHPSFPKYARNELTRYITAFKGVLCDNEEDAQFVIAENRESVNKDLSGVKVVRPDWVWECNDAGQLLPIDEYEL